MTTIVLWLLIATGGHGYYTVPGISSEEECKWLATELARYSWGQQNVFGEPFKCLPYRAGR